MKNNRTGAFTVVELLVVIAIIGILVGMLLPAVQSVREAARRTHCMNNLRQMGLAVQNYHNSQNELPPSRNYDHYVSWAFLILPHIEGLNLFEHWDPELKYYYQSETARTTPIPQFNCPSRRGRSIISTAGDSIVSPFEFSAHIPGVTSDYACSAGNGLSGAWNWITANGVFVMGIGKTDPPLKDDGFFGEFPPPNARLVSWKSRTQLRSVADGTTSTIMIGEKHIVLGFEGIAQEDGAIYNGDHPGNFSRPGGPGSPIARHNDKQFYLFGSAHPNLCNFVFVDGHTESISAGISTDVLGKLTSRSGGEIVSTADY